MAAIRGSALPIEIQVSGVNLTDATEITFVIAWNVGQDPIIPGKKKSTGDITVTYDAGTETSTLSLLLSASDTSTLTRSVHYALFVDDGSPGGDWVPDDGLGVIQFVNSPKKS